MLRVVGDLLLDLNIQLIFIELLLMIQPDMLTHDHSGTANTQGWLQPPHCQCLPLPFSCSELSLGVPGQPFNLGLVDRVARLLLNQGPRELILTWSKYSPALRSGMHRIGPPQLGRQQRSGNGRAPGLASSWRDRGRLSSGHSLEELF